MFVRLYWKPVAALACAVLLLFSGWTLRGWKAGLDANREARRVLDRMEADRLAGIKENERIRKLLSPKAAPTINRVVHENPSACRVPEPVHDSVRNAIAEANAAIRDAGDLP